MKKLFALLLVVFTFSAMLASCSLGAQETFVWEDVELNHLLPTPATNNGKIHSNSQKSLWMDVVVESDSEYKDYVNACKEKGFTIESDSSSNSYYAYNADGYKLSLYYAQSSRKINISLDEPMKLTDIEWPSSGIGAMLPAPFSSKGSISTNKSSNFGIYVGDMPVASYGEYVDLCMARGFNVDYNKTDSYFTAKNTDGYSLTVKYHGFNIIYISIEEPEEPETVTPDPTISETPSQPSADKVDPTFKAAMDSYEKFFDEYIAFMKKYQANPSDVTLLTQYAQYMTQYTDTMQKMNSINQNSLSAADLKYYLEVVNRVTQKLANAAM